MNNIHIPIRDTLILYTTATCNLRCVYCFIDKSPALQKIDEMLERSYEDPDYYLNFSKQFFTQDGLKRIEFWGGETSYGLHRVIDLSKKLIDYYPNLQSFNISTNFVHPRFFEEFYNFLQIFNDFPNRNFVFHLQLSMDGPEYINDKNRGQGVTKQWIENFYHLSETVLDVKPKNVKLEIGFKQTLSNIDFKILSTEEKVKDYFTFFDDLITYAKKYDKNNEICIFLALPNTVSPGPYTQEDGKNFANYCRITRELEKQNCFKNYKQLTTYIPRDSLNLSYSYCTQCGYCGGGITNIGLLPDNYVSICHMGFTQLIEEYKINSLKNHQDEDNDKVVIMKDLFTHIQTTPPLCFPADQLPQRIEQYSFFFHQKSTFKIVNIEAQIKVLAACGQIDSCFTDPILANKAAHYLYETLPSCLRDNLGVVGTATTMPMGNIKLLLNGAYKYLVDFSEDSNNGKNLSR